MGNPRDSGERRADPASTSEEGVLAAFEAAFDAFVVALRRSRARAIGRDGLSLSQYELLRALTDVDGRPVGSLADLAGIAPPSATQMLDGLERMSLVRRDRPSSDRRTVRISLTAEGRRWVERKRRQLARRRRRLFESLSLEERRHAEPLLRHLADLIGEL